MEIVDIVTNLISNLGFPIACCVVLFIQNNKLTNIIGDLKVSISKMSETLEEVSSAINK